MSRTYSGWNVMLFSVVDGWAVKLVVSRLVVSGSGVGAGEGTEAIMFTLQKKRLIFMVK